MNPASEDFDAIRRRMAEIDAEKSCDNCTGLGWVERPGDMFPVAWDVCQQCFNAAGRNKPT